MPSTLAAFVVKEKFTKAKHIQLLSSVSPTLYWIANYSWNMLLFLIIDALVIGAFFVYGTTVSQIFMYSKDSTAALSLLFIFYSFSILPLCYVYSIFFSDHTNFQITVTLINFVTGFLLVLVYYGLTLIGVSAAVRYSYV